MINKLFHPRTNSIRYLKSCTNKWSQRIISQIVVGITCYPYIPDEFLNIIMSRSPVYDMKYLKKGRLLILLDTVLANDRTHSLELGFS